MSLQYHLVQRPNPAKPEDPKKFYAAATNRGDVSLRALAKEINEISTVSVPDTTAVIEALLQIIPRHLAEGAVVRLGEFGSFSVNVSSEGAESEDTFTGSLIKGLKILFRPGRELTGSLNNVRYEKMANHAVPKPE